MPAGRKVKAVIPGGSSAPVLGADELDVAMEFEALKVKQTMAGSGGVIVMDDTSCMVRCLWRVARFYAEESCGQCTPCRVGTAKARALIEQPRWDLPLLADLSQVMRDASICGLGQAAPNPFDCVIKYFPHELETMKP